MDAIRRLLTLLLVMTCGICIIIWAGYFNDGLDFVNMGRHARKFPMGPDTGPVAIGLFSLMVAYFIYPADKKHDRR